MPRRLPGRYTGADVLNRLILLASLTAGAFAPATGLSFHDPKLFPRGEIVKKQVWFWEKIFDRYDSQSFVIHDTRFPEVIIDVIDFNRIATPYGERIRTMTQTKKKITERYVRRYRKGINRFRQYGVKAAKISPIEDRLHQVYSQNPKAYAKLLKGGVQIRTQMGLKDEFERALHRASTYLPQMEAIFTSYGLPVMLTRLPFVESMFNLKARSKVGASGIWQFMPRTAKQFLTLNTNFDERNSPLKATHAAARLLRKNYESLGTWPLAITAYNYGASGIRRAVKTVGSTDLNELIEHYPRRRFGFASENFYAEFYAVSKVFEQKHQARMKELQSMNLVQVTLPGRASIAEVARRSAISMKILKKFNNCLKPRVFRRVSHRVLPKNYALYIPKEFMNESASRYFQTPAALSLN